jgi:hypothetical protein
MMHRLITLAALSATLLAFGCTTPRSRHLRSGPAPPDPDPQEVAILPMLGSRNPFPVRYKYQLLVSPSQTLPAYDVRFKVCSTRLRSSVTRLFT